MQEAYDSAEARMQYNSEIGKIYDSIFFFYEYYNEDIIQHDFINRFDNTELMSYCFRQIRNSISPPDFLRPLFCAGSTKSNLISEFFAEMIDFQNDTIDSFISMVTSNIDLIYQKALDKIFANSPKEIASKIFPIVAPAGYVEAIYELQSDYDYKLQVSLLLGNFHYAISQFIELLKKVYSLVDALHAKFKKVIEVELEAIQSGSRDELCQNELQCTFLSSEDGIVSIALLNQFVILGPCRRGSSTEILVGLRYAEALNGRGGTAISMEQFWIACGNELRIKILNALSENHEATLSQLSKNLNVAPSTLVRHIDLLSDACIILVSRQEGLQIFYTINHELFRKMQPIITDFLKKMQM